jgi:hypothetical protein
MILMGGQGFGIARDRRNFATPITAKDKSIYVDI